jgi:hypothetical protein
MCSGILFQPQTLPTEVRLDRSHVVVPAIVVAEHDDTESGASTVTVRYVAAGKTYTETVAAAPFRRTPRVGTTTKVEYVPSDPSQVHLAGFTAQKLPLFAIELGLWAAIFSAYTLRKRTRRKRASTDTMPAA